MHLVRVGIWGRARGASFAVLRACLMGIFALSALPPDAQTQPSPHSAQYQVVSRDVLRVEVSGRKDISGQYPVDADGAITLPSIGRVNAAGRTTSEIATDIARRVSLTTRDNPQVSVSVVESFTLKYFILGAVLLPGAYNFSQPPTVWEAISKAGGASEDADLTKVEIITESQLTPTIVDVAAAVRASNLAALQRLHPGDTVRVPRAGAAAGGAAGVVYVFGAVGTQGPQPLSDAPDLVAALIRSGPSAEANFKSVEIVRKDGNRVVSMKVNMDDYFSGASLSGNPALMAGDTVRLPPKPKSKWFGAIGLLGTLLGLTTTILILTNNSNN